MGAPSTTRVLDRATFTRELLLNLVTELEAVTGREQARDVVELVGLTMGERMEEEVVGDRANGPWTPDRLGHVFVDLKRRIDGDFSVESANDERVVLTNTRCPFGADVDGRASLCMMTSSVFGGIAARHFGYARVDVEEAIARGDAGCRVVVHLKETDDADDAWSREYRGGE